MTSFIPRGRRVNRVVIETPYSMRGTPLSQGKWAP